MEIFSWGANSHGQLGQGVVSEQCNTPQPVIKTWNGKIKQVSCGGAHTILMDEHGHIYSCGWNHQKQLGFENKTLENNNCHTFTRIWELSGITFTKICTGWDSSAGISDKNILYLWGSNVHGQLGLPKEHFPDAMRPLQLELKAKAISMGMRHTIMVDINGCVWATGIGKKGQLGLGQEITKLDTFKKIPKLLNVTNVACGQHHTLAWSKTDNVLYAWGDNTHGQLGLGKHIQQIFDPTKVNSISDYVEQVLHVYSGWTHSAVLLSDGRAIYWGRNNYGQLGTDQISESFNILKINDIPISQLSLGSEHSICLTKDGTLWSWGWNEHGNTGTGNTDNVTQPLKVNINSTNLYKIFCGTGHNFAVSVNCIL